MVYADTGLSGSGTEENPYLIGTEADLIAFRDAVSADATANEVSQLCAKLIADVTLTKTWTPIQKANQKKYAGTIDGDGHKISNMNITGGAVVGFIGEGGEGLTIKNLTLEGTFTGVNHAGGFVGRPGGAATFINCTNNKLDCWIWLLRLNLSRSFLSLSLRSC